MTTTINRQRLIFAIIVFIAFVIAVVGIYNTFTKPYPGLNDFMSRWEGARSYWLEGLNPYGDQASFNIQKRIYGRAVVEGEDPGYFAYPFYTVFLVGPLVVLDYAWASAVWMVVLGASLVGALFLLISLFNWRPSPLILTTLVLWSIFAYYPSRGLILGQLGIVVYFLEVITIWALVKNYHGVAGIALALSTIKPQMGYLIVPFLLLWGVRRRHWLFVRAFIVTFSGLILFSFLLVPSWLIDWLTQVGIYDTYTALGSPVWIVFNYYLQLGNIVTRSVEFIFYGFLAWVWYTVLWQRKEERWLWAIAMTLTITHLVAPRTATPHYVVFMIPLIFYLRAVSRAYHQKSVYYNLLILIILFIAPWIHFLLTVVGEFEHPTVYLPLPFAMFLLLWLTRQKWYQAQEALGLRHV